MSPVPEPRWPRRPVPPPNRAVHRGWIYTPCHPGPEGESNLRLRWGGLRGLACTVCGRRPPREPAGYSPPPVILPPSPEPPPEPPRVSGG